MEQQRSAIEVFCCYDYEDGHLMKELQRQQLITVWHNRDIAQEQSQVRNYRLKRQGLEKWLRHMDCSQFYCFERKDYHEHLLAHCPQVGVVRPTWVSHSPSGGL